MLAPCFIFNLNEVVAIVNTGIGIICNFDGVAEGARIFTQYDFCEN